MILFTTYSKSTQLIVNLPLLGDPVSSFLFLQYRTPVLCLQSGGWIQCDKTLVPTELLPFWHQTQGLLEETTTCEDLFWLICANSDYTHSFVLCPTLLSFSLSIKTWRARIILLQRIKSM